MADIRDIRKILISLSCFSLGYKIRVSTGAWPSHIAFAITRGKASSLSYPPRELKIIK